MGRTFFFQQFSPFPLGRVGMGCLFCLFFSVSFAQQTTLFSQYLFNNFGLNPAAAGKGTCLELKAGRREQWVGFPNAPTTTFFSLTKVFKKKSYNNGWHAIGYYMEQDRQNVIKSEVFYPSYSYHMRVSPDYYASFGVFAGFRVFSASTELFDPDDPAFSSLGVVYVVPDIAMGGRLYSKNNFLDFSVKNIYKEKVKLGGKQVGTPSKLRPHLNVIAGTTIESNTYYYTYIPSVNLRWTPLVRPSADVTLLMFIKKKIGFGLSYRLNDAIIGIVQYKYKNILSIGISYDYVLSKIRTGASHSREVMLGYSSCTSGADIGGKTHCPAYEH